MIAGSPFVFLLPILGIVLGLAWLYCRWRHLLAVRAAVAIVWLAFALLFALAFHDRYWRWRDCFNELGRCYDSEAGVMVEQAGFIWGSLALLFGLLFLGSVRNILRQRTIPEIS